MFNFLQKARETFGNSIQPVIDDNEVTEKELHQIQYNSLCKSYNQLQEQVGDSINNYLDIKKGIDLSIKNIDKKIEDESFTKGDIEKRKVLFNRIDNLKKSYREEVEQLRSKQGELSTYLKKNLRNITRILEATGDYAYKQYDSLGKKRSEMPQIDKDNIDDFLIHFSGKSNKSKVKKVTKRIDQLLPTQCEFDEDKVLSIMYDYQNGNLEDNTFLISKEGRILDGHHRWAGLAEMEPDKEVTCYQVNLPMRELLRRAKLMKIARKEDVQGNEVRKAEMTEAQQKKFDQVMSEWDAGTLKDSHGNKVESKDKALAIAYSEAGISKSEILNAYNVIKDAYNKGKIDDYTFKKAYVNYRKKIDNINKAILSKEQLNNIHANIITSHIPNYKPSTGTKHCGNCGAYNGEQGHGNCEMFNTKVRADYVCDDWVEEYVKKGYYDTSEYEINNEQDKELSAKKYADVILTSPAGNILLLKRNKHDELGPGEYALPGGTQEADEESYETAARELQEETNLSVDELTYERTYDNGNGTSTDIYSATTDQTDGIILDINEHEDYIWVSPDDIDQLKTFKGTGERVKEISNTERHELAKSFNLIKEGFNKGLVDESDFRVAYDNYIQKAKSNLVKKQVWVTRGGKTFRQTVYVNPDSGKKEETPTGLEISEPLGGMEIQKYSDKAILISGNTYANKDTLREIKNEIGVGSYNKKLSGWVFPIKFQDTILGLIWSKLINSGDTDKANAIQNQKNSSFNEGDTVNIGDLEGSIIENSSDSEGIKYNIRLSDGTELLNVNEKILEKEPLQNDGEIADSLNNNSAESRYKTDKQIFGFKPIEDLHNYTLFQYAELHGIDKSDIDEYLAKQSGKERTEEAKKKKQPLVSKDKKQQSEGLTKNQIIAKLVSKHKEAVRKHINDGNVVSDDIVEPYDDLKELNEQKKKELSEEHKRKISEALKKDGAEDVAKEFIDSMSEEELNELKDKFSEGVDQKVKEEQDKLAELIAQKEAAKKEKYDLYEKARETDNFDEKNEYKRQAKEKSNEEVNLRIKVLNQSNRVTALNNGGSLVDMNDAIGVKHEEIPDFRNIEVSNIDYDVDTISDKEKPNYIPEIDEDIFRNKGYTFDAIKIDNDSYMIATRGYSEHSYSYEGINVKKEDYDPEYAGYTMLSLDQLVLTQDYYVTKQKAKYKQEAEERNRKVEEKWDNMSDNMKERYLDRIRWGGLPAKVKKQIDKETWEKLGWQEREKYYKPIKKYAPKKLKGKFEEGTMPASFHNMHERFVNPEDTKVTGNLEKLTREQSIKGGIGYANPVVSKNWKDFREKLDWKINDIKVQREEISEQRQKAIETSYGESNVNTDLLNEYGIKVKRQNGEDIKPNEIEQIKNAWEDVQKTFGSLKENAKENGLKISHAGETYMFARRAIGIYVPNFKTLGVTAKLGEDQLGFTMGHETAHWIDNMIGEKEGKRYASNNYDSTAGQIAINLRKGMNKPTNSNYLNSTHECFARAMEMHHAIQTKGEGALRAGEQKYIATGEYTSLDYYNKNIKPLVEQFLEENKDVLKSYGLDYFGKSDSFELVKKAFNEGKISLEIFQKAYNNYIEQ